MFLRYEMQDVAWLADQLGNVKGFYQVEDPRFTHLDFLLADNAKDVVYDRIFPLLPTA